MRRLRVGIFGVSQEAMIAAPGFLDPATMEVSRGQAMLDPALWMVRGIVAGLREAADVEIVPLAMFRCRATPAFSRPDYEAVKAEIVGLLDAHGPFDGVVAANHGALEVDGLKTSGDTDLLAAVRRALGEAVPMTVALDLHGHITPGMLGSASVFSALRTTPHRDDARTGRAAAGQLMRILSGGARPRTACVRIPLFLPGEVSMTTYEPARSLYASLHALDAQPGVLECNIMVGFAWNDRPWVGMTACVTCDGDIAASRRHALDLAARIWAERANFRLEMPAYGVGDGLDEAARSVQHPVYVSDSGDNVSAGAYGDLTFVLQEALARPALGDVVVAGIIAPAAVRACQAAGPGATVRLAIGAEHISRPARPLPVDAVVEELGTHFAGNPSAWARVRIGHVTATLHARRVQVNTPAHLEALGIHPTRHRVYVVKLGYLHPGLEDLGPRHILLLSDGDANLDLRRLTWRQIVRPAYPFDPDMEWTPEQGLFTDAAP